MATFPNVEARQAWVSSTSDTNSFAPTMPSGIQKGDLLVCIFSCDAAPTITASGWNKLGQASNGSIVTGAIFWKIADGGDTITVATTSNEQASAVTMRISNAIGVLGTSANGSSTNSNPPNHNAFISKDYLWIATRSGDSTVVATVAPTNYSNLQTQAAGGTSGASTNTAERSLTASSDNPGTFTSNTEQWVSWTLAIVPNDGTPVILATNSGNVDTNTTNSVALTIPTGWSNTAIVATITGYDFSETDRVMTSVNWNTTESLSLISTERDVGVPDGSYCGIWMLANPTTGQHNIDVTFAGTLDNQSMGLYALANVKQTTQPNVEAGGDSIGGASPWTQNITTTVPNCLIVGVHDIGPNSAYTAGQTSIGGFYTNFHLHGYVTNPTASTFAWTETGDANAGPLCLVALTPFSIPFEAININQAVRRAAYY